MMLNHQDMKSNKQKFKLISFFKLLPLQINKELKKFKKFKVNNKTIVGLFLIMAFEASHLLSGENLLVP